MRYNLEITLEEAFTGKNATLKIYGRAPHGLAYTHKDQLNADLLGNELQENQRKLAESINKQDAAAQEACH